MVVSEQTLGHGVHNIRQCFLEFEPVKEIHEADDRYEGLWPSTLWL
jgi:hypothetical protein